MAAERFPVEAGHILMFARGIADPNPIYQDAEYAAATEPGSIIAPPTFVMANAQFDPDYRLRPKLGEAWFGSGRNATGVERTTGGSGSGSGGLHAEQHFHYHRPLRAGEVLTGTSLPGRQWEKDGRRGGTLAFKETITEFRTLEGELVVTARSVGVQTAKVVEQGN